jgi:hypothetical protein
MREQASGIVGASLFSVRFSSRPLGRTLLHRSDEVVGEAKATAQLADFETSAVR